MEAAADEDVSEAALALTEEAADNYAYILSVTNSAPFFIP